MEWRDVGITRRAFLRSVPAAVAALTLPIVPSRAGASCAVDNAWGPGDLCGSRGTVTRPPGDPGSESWWVMTYLPTKTWPTASEVNEPVSTVSDGRHFRVDGLQQGYRLPVWDPGTNSHVYIGVEAVGEVDPPFWSAFAEDGRWIDVTLTPLQHLRAMQGDVAVFRDLVTAGVDRRTKPGFYRIFRRVYNETMDSRTVPDATRRYLLKNVLYTQYFHGDGSAIHYNWWASSWGYPGSQGCLGMRLEGSKFMWEGANIDTPVVIHY